ncbi:MAG TPA: hypothetical protein VLU06_07170 [Thermoanaerobaculia bacterium]|nr:hypothetical protein [Thermoanaerobaculia bacterium]
MVERVFAEQTLTAGFIDGDQTRAAAPTAQPFVGPDQAALEQMLKQMTEVA